MRFYEGDYAYEIERVRDAATQVVTGWRYNVYRIRPDDKLIRSGSRETQQDAETAARGEIESVIRADQKSETADGRNAA